MSDDACPCALFHRLLLGILSGLGVPVVGLRRLAFSDNSSKGVITYYPNLLGSELLPQFIIGISKLGFVVLGHGGGLFVGMRGHSDM
jgi:hypothetical protein